MAESSQAVAYDDLRKDVGFHLGYGRTPDNWTTRQTDDIAHAVKFGPSEFYNCGYDWSFLKPIAMLVLPQGDSTLQLPDDYAAMDGPVSVSVDGQSSLFAPLVLGPWQTVYEAERRIPGTQGRAPGG